MKRSFVLTPEATADLREIFLDLAGDSGGAAERLRSEFCETFQRLAQSPATGHCHDELLSQACPQGSFTPSSGAETDPDSLRGSRNSRSGFVPRLQAQQPVVKVGKGRSLRRYCIRAK